MAELLTPGVIIQEVEFGPQPIEGVSTSTAGFVGETERGPSEGPPTLVTTFADFQRKFGGLLSGKDLPYSISGFFDNGGRRAFISRAVGSGSTRGVFNPTVDAGNYNVRLTSGSISSGSQTVLTLSSVVGIIVDPLNNTLNLIPIGAPTGTSYKVVKVDGATGTVVIDAPNVVAGPNTHFAQIPGTTVSNVLAVQARDFGPYSERIGVLVDATYGDSVRVVSFVDSQNIIVSNVAPFAVGMRIQLETPYASGQKRETARIAAVDIIANKLTLVAALANTYAAGNKVFVINWRTTVTFDGAVVETLSSLRSTSTADMDADVAAASQWIRVSFDQLTDERLPTFPNGAGRQLSPGSAPAPSATDVVGIEVPSRTGLKAIEAQQGVSIIAAPGFTDEVVVGELIAQAERRQDRFAVFESSLVRTTNPIVPPDVTTVLAERGQYNSRYGAMYHPWLTVRDPLTNADIPIPPSGHVVGAYARTDNDRGVFKAPANVTLRALTGFLQTIPDGEQDLFNPAGVNILRAFDGLGSVIWGARTISAEPIWRYVPVRRLFIFIEQSLVRGTRFAVFEPNDTRLWARLRDAITNFLTTQWRAGALFGSKPQEAFFVKIDETTTTEDDRANGRLNILIGLAPVRPAEFIVFQIGQAPSSVIIAEQS